LGALYGKREHLEAMPPYQTGGGMIRSVTFEKTTYAPPPEKFEPGTPNIADVMGLGAAIDYLQAAVPETAGETTSKSRLAFAAEHEHYLTDYATKRLSEIEGLKIWGTAREKSGTVSFTMANAHPHDIGTILDLEGVAIRAGHHCCQPLMKFLGVPATARASFGIYNTEEEIDTLVRAVNKVKEVLG
jgi:cysteine desulfurase/selenocysteine lyase